MRDDKKKNSIAYIGSIIFHILLFLIIAFTGLFHLYEHKQQEIIEISLMGGGHAGGSGSGGKKAAAAPKTPKKAVKPKPKAAPPQPQPTVIEKEVPKDALLEHKDKAPKITRQKVETPKPTPQPEPEKEVSTPNPSPADTNDSSEEATSGSDSGSSTGSGSSKDGIGNGSGPGNNPGTGSGSGGGTGTGDGRGSGEGSGDGRGSGHGNGDGTGNGTQEATPPRLIHREQPHYPPAAVRMGMEASFRVAFIVNEQGTVDSIQIISGDSPSMIRSATERALRKYRFQPARNKYGVPIKSKIVLNVYFELK